MVIMNMPVIDMNTLKSIMFTEALRMSTVVNCIPPKQSASIETKQTDHAVHGILELKTPRFLWLVANNTVATCEVSYKQ